MASIIEYLSGPIQEALPEVDREGLDPAVLRVAPTTNPSFGDYQFNGAMQLAKKLKKSR